jgi:hypothetical protein
MSETLTLAGIASRDLAGLNASVAEGLIEPIIIDGDRAGRESEHRARMSAHVAHVLDGGDLSTMEPTC